MLVHSSTQQLRRLLGSVRLACFFLYQHLSNIKQFQKYHQTNQISDRKKNRKKDQRIEANSTLHAFPLHLDDPSAIYDIHTQEAYLELPTSNYSALHFVL